MRSRSPSPAPAPRPCRRPGYQETFGLGERPALLIIDVEYNFTGDVDEPILDSIAKYANSCGSMA
jgi:hypothetical protein